jgi:pimeloyl-ACP methyl ester carboxylesterase
MNPQFLKGQSGSIAYLHQMGTGPGVVFLPGFRSDMMGSKAAAVASWCASQGIACTRFDYRAHGQSEGDFRDYTIGGGLEDTLTILDNIATGPQILIGSSMGGWIAMLAALQRKEQVAAILGIAAAPDFTERGIWARMTPVQREMMERDGEVKEHSEFWGDDNIYTRKLIDDGREQLLLEDVIPITMPVRLLQGMQDDSVPWETAMELVDKLGGEDVQLQLVKDGDHRLYRPEDLTLMIDTLRRLYGQIGGIERDAA